MASKITIRFTGEGVEGATLTLKTGMVYIFKEQGLKAREVAIGSFNTKVKPETLASNFKNSFNTSDNYTNLFKVTYSATALDENGVEQTPTGTLDGIVTIEHPDNGYFDAATANASFIILTKENTATSSTIYLDLALKASPTDNCEKILIEVKTNLKGGRITIEMPLANIIDVVNDTGATGNFIYTLDRLRPNLKNFVLVKLYDTAFSTTARILKSLIVPGTLKISEVKITGSPFGAMIDVVANATGLEYSLDQINWRNNSQFPNLLEGVYTVYVRDPYGCVKSIGFEVLPEHTTGITLEPYIHFPIHNSLRPVDRNGGIFLNMMAKETPGIIDGRNYFHEYLVNDYVQLQFRSTLSNHKAFLYDCHGNSTELFIEKLTNNISRVNIYEGNYKDFEGQLAVYFGSGNIYNPDDSVQDYGHDLDGLLPNWYEKDVFLKIDNLETAKIERIYFDEEEEVTYAITNLPASGAGFGVKITSIHTENPYEVYQFGVNFYEAGQFVVEVDYGSDKVWFEPVLVKEQLHSRYLQVKWYSDENNEILYSSGIKQMRRIPWVKYFTYKSTVQKEIFSSDTTIRNIRSKSFATYELAFRPMPMEVARGIDYGFQAAGGVVEIQGALFVCDGELSVEPLGNMYKVTATLTLIGQSMSAPQYGGVGDSFLIVDENANGVAFLRIA